MRERQVKAAVELLDGGATVPFIARYRKEATGSLDDAQLRTLEERLRYLRELEERRAAILESIARAGQARRRAAGADPRPPTPRPGSRTSTCRSSRSAAPRRRSPARPASSRSPTRCSATPTLDPHAAAAAFVDADKGVADAAAALDGARAILVERFAEDADLIGELRERMWSAGPAGRRRCARARRRRARSSPTTSTSPSRSPSCPRTASSRCSAARRRRSSTSSLEPEEPAERARPVARTSGASSPAVRHRRPRPPRPTSGSTTPSAGPGAPGSSSTSASTCGCGCGTAAEDEAVRVFAANLRDLLLAAPAGTRATHGPGPGLPHRREGRRRRRAPARSSPPTRSTRTCRSNRWDESLATLAALAEEHAVELIAIGNGTASRETDKLAARPDRGSTRS